MEIKDAYKAHATMTFTPEQEKRKQEMNKELTKAVKDYKKDTFLQENYRHAIINS